MAGLLRARVRRAGVLAGALLVIPVALVVAAPPAAAADIITACAGDNDVTTLTFTLTADCATTEPLTVPDGYTIDGDFDGDGVGDFIISASNPPAPAHTYTGAVVTNAPGATSMNIENLTITGPDGGFPFPLPAPSCNTFPGPGLFGIFFNDASGSVSNVEVLNIFQTNTAPGSPACGVGHSIRADGVTAPRTVTITDTAVSNFQKGGLFASGMMTMDVSASTIGPPSSVPFSIAQNSVNYTNSSTNSNPAVGASGTMTDSIIIGSSYSATGPADPAATASTAVLLFGANNVTIDDNEIIGSDLGISVSASSTNVTISFNAINRPVPPTPDSFGIGVSVDPGLAETTSLICNTFDGWNFNIVGDIQVACAPLPAGATCQAYSAPAPTVEGGVEGDPVPPFTWELESGSLPPGLSLAADGTITGTPTSVGTFAFTASVTDANGFTASVDQTITIAAGCPTPSPTPTPSVAPTAAAAALPATGTPDPLFPTMVVGLLLLAAGAALTGLGRRRIRRH